MSGRSRPSRASSPAARPPLPNRAACATPPSLPSEADMLGAVLPLILDLAPQLAGAIFGRKGNEAAAEAASLVQTVTGSDPSTTAGAAAAASAIETDPQTAHTLQQKLADLYLRLQEAEDRARETARQAVLE